MLAKIWLELMLAVINLFINGINIKLTKS